MKKLTTYAPVDAAVDQKARDFLSDCLPPMLTQGSLLMQHFIGINLLNREKHNVCVLDALLNRGTGQQR